MYARFVDDDKVSGNGLWALMVTVGISGGACDWIGL